MVVGIIVPDADKHPLAVGDNFIEWVKQFPHVGSLISDNGRVGAEIKRRITSASKAFGALQHAIINNFHLSIETDQLV